VALSVLAGVALSIAVIGVLFKLQLWPMSAFWLLLGVASLAVITIATFVIRSARPDLNAYTRGILLRSLPLWLACSLLYALPSATLWKFYYRDNPEMGRLLFEQGSTDDPVQRERLRARIDSLDEARLRNR